MKTRSHRRFRQAFTLIELLLVIAIIGILAALLLPAIEKARSRSKQAKCISQLQQIGVAFHSFAHDHNDRFPYHVPANEGGTMEMVLEASRLSEFYFGFRNFQALSNELVTPKVLICPSDRGKRIPAPSFASLSNGNISYTCGIGPRPGQSQLLLSADGRTDLFGIDARSIVSGDRQTWYLGFYHDGRSTILFGDGHIESMTYAQWREWWRSLGNVFVQELWNPVTPPSHGNAAGETSRSGGDTGGEGTSISDKGGVGGGNASSPNPRNSGFAALQSYFQPPGAPQNASPQPSSSTPERSTPTTFVSPSLDTPPPFTNLATSNSVAKTPANRAPPAQAAAPAQSPTEEPSMPKSTTRVESMTTEVEPAERSFNWLLLMLLVLVSAGLLGAVLERRRRKRGGGGANKAD